MDENALVELIGDALWSLADEDEDLAESLRSADKFSDTGLLTNDAGLLIRFEDGSEFQVTVVKSR